MSGHGTQHITENAAFEPDPSQHKFDPNFTQHVIDSMGPKTSPRMRQVMTGLIKHVHDFAREVELTVDEWMAGVEMINWAGQMSDNKRNEGQLVCDVIGLESLVDEITYKVAESEKTQTAILGPFFRHDAPTRENGTSIIDTPPSDGEVTLMHGQVLDYTTKKPVANASIDVWQASTNGLYEQQDDAQADCNLRGKFFTDSEGRYNFYCLRPTPYPVPFDGPAGKMLQLMDRHPFRPAHIHLIVQHKDFQPLTTQIFDPKDKYLDNDSVFAVKDSLVGNFKQRKGDDKATMELEYDVLLAPLSVVENK